MGSRHQLFVVARMRKRYRTLAAVHHQSLSGIRPLERCLRLLAIFQDKTNHPPIRQELRAAREHSDNLWARRDIFQPFPYVATCLTVGCSFDPDAAYQDRVHPKRFNTTLREVDNNDGITVVDISDPDRLSYCFAFLAGQWGVEESLSRPLSPATYLSRYIRPPGHVSRVTDDSDGEDDASLKSDDMKDYDYTRSEISPEERLENDQVIERFEPFELMDEKALESIWSEQVVGLNDTLEHDQDHNAPSKSLRDTAIDGLFSSVLKEPAHDIDTFATVQELPDFRPRLRNELGSRAQNSKLPSSSVTVRCMDLAFSGESHVDLSAFGDLSAQCLVEAASKILKSGKVRSLNLSHLRQLHEPDLMTILETSAHLETLYLLEMPQVSLSFINSLWNDPNPCSAEIYHSELLQLPFVERYTYSKLMSDLQSPAIKTGPYSPIKSILFARIFETPEEPILRKADGIAVDWPRFKPSFEQMPSSHTGKMQSYVFPVHDIFIQPMKLVSSLASFISVTTDRETWGDNQAFSIGYTMAKSLAMVSSIPGGPCTKAGPLPAALFSASSIAAKILGTYWRYPSPSLRQASGRSSLSTSMILIPFFQLVEQIIKLTKPA